MQNKSGDNFQSLAFHSKIRHQLIIYHPFPHQKMRISSFKSKLFHFSPILVFILLAAIGQIQCGIDNNDDRKDIVAFGQTYAKWCRQLLDKSLGLNGLLPLLGEPKIFNEVPQSLIDTMTHGLERALSALYRIRDGMVTDENVWNLIVSKWEVVLVEPVYDDDGAFDEEEMKRRKRKTEVGGDLYNADEFGTLAEMKRKEKQKKAKDLEKQKKAKDNAKAKFPFNPYVKNYDQGFPWEKSEGQNDTKDVALLYLKLSLEDVATFLHSQADHLPAPKLDEIAEVNSLNEVLSKRRVKGTNNKPGGIWQNLETNFNLLIYELENVGTKNHVGQQRELDMPPPPASDEEAEEGSNRRGKSPNRRSQSPKRGGGEQKGQGQQLANSNPTPKGLTDQEKEKLGKCQIILQLWHAKGIAAKEIALFEKMERRFINLAKIWVSSAKKVYRSGCDTFPGAEICLTRGGEKGTKTIAEPAGEKIVDDQDKQPLLQKQNSGKGSRRGRRGKN